jgi:hypothetical protein
LQKYDRNLYLLTASIWDLVETATRLVDHLIGKRLEHIALDKPDSSQSLPIPGQVFSPHSPLPALSTFENLFHSQLLPLKRPLGEILEETPSTFPTTDSLDICLSLGAATRETQLDDDYRGRARRSGRHDNVGVK